MLLIGYGTVADNTSVLKDSKGKDGLIQLITVRSHNLAEMVHSRGRDFKIDLTMFIVNKNKNLVSL